MDPDTRRNFRSISQAQRDHQLGYLDQDEVAPGEGTLTNAIHTNFEFEILGLQNTSWTFPASQTKDLRQRTNSSTSYTLFSSWQRK